MSFEGYYQHLCENGHYWCCDAYCDNDTCNECGGNSVWENLVDQTNDAGTPVHLIEVHKRQCITCGNVLEVKYEIPIT